uniref:Leucine-rich repeat-containing N-terminal plant-type domain-containing protein n=1 Tax=Pyramimonas obovata TaxID=1411642 RepID=A0A7S0RQB8_9CHLO
MDPPMSSTVRAFMGGLVRKAVLSLVVVLCAVRDTTHAESLGSGPVIKSDEEVLKAVKEAITADPNGYLEGWSSDDVCEWTGVVCGQLTPKKQTVTKIDWSSQRLEGSLPDSFHKLVHLQALYLQENSFGGKLPDFSNWAGLKGIYVFDNYFTGVLPASVGSLKRLQALNVRNNQLSGEFPKDLEKLTSIKELDLGFNDQLKGTLPADIEKLSNLEFLRLNGCQLHGTVPSMSKLSNLKAIRLNRNYLAGTLPAFEKTMTSLQELDIGSNQIQGELPAVGELPMLKSLDLRSNKFKGTIPSEYGKLPKVEWLKLSSNQLTGTIPTELGQMPNLQALYLDGNRLSGSVPAEMANTARLKDMSVENNSKMCGDKVKIKKGKVRSKGTRVGKACATSPTGADEF